MATDAHNPEEIVAATRARYGVLGFLCSLSFILYIDRICISQAATHIEHDLGISHTRMGIVFAAFTVAYGLFEIPTGRWGDRFGSRGVLTRIVLWWSLFTALTGCVPKFSFDSGRQLWLPLWNTGVPLAFNSLVLLVLVRFLFGAGEAGAIPNSARVIARWFPSTARGPAQGIFNATALLGGAIAPIAAQFLIRHVGWRWSFVAFGSLGMYWAAAFYSWFRDDPGQHPRVNDAELRRIRSGVACNPTNEPHPAVPWRRVLTSSNVWMGGLVITCSAFCTYLYFTWIPTYFKQGRGVSDDRAGALAALVLAGGAVGGAAGGYLSDWLVRRTGSRCWGRRLIGVGGLSLAALALWASIQVDDAVHAAALAGLASFAANLHLPAWWGVVTDISGKHVGALFGLMNSLGVPGAVASQVYLGRFVDWRTDHGFSGRAAWDPGLYAYVVVLCFGACGWLFLDATRSAVEAPTAKTAQ
jgi:MFS family permease